jgi:hypothetical protein
VQTPAPLQNCAGVNRLAAAEQDCATQTVPLGYFWQAPLPSQLPLLPQVATPDTPHWPLGSAPLTAMGEQVPRVAARVHETHGPSHAALQQTFCPGSPAHVSPVWH